MEEGKLRNLLDALAATGRQGQDMLKSFAPFKETEDGVRLGVPPVISSLYDDWLSTDAWAKGAMGEDGKPIQPNKLAGLNVAGLAPLGGIAAGGMGMARGAVTREAAQETPTIMGAFRDNVPGQGGTIEDFASSRLIPNDGRSLTATRAYEDYVDWAHVNRVPPMDYADFNGWMGEQGYTKQHIAGRPRFVGVGVPETDAAGLSQASKPNQMRTDFFGMTPSNEAGAAALDPYERASLNANWRKKVARTGEFFSNSAESSAAPLALNALDSASGVRAYHGTGARDYSKFELGSDLGIHFGPPSQANRFAEADRGTGGSPRVYPVDLDITNPINLDGAAGELGTKGVYDMAHQLRTMSKYGNPPFSKNESDALFQEVYGSGKMGPDEGMQRIRDFLIDKGYDGASYLNSVDGSPATSYVAFKPGTVRSATTGETLFSNPTKSAAAPLALNSIDQQSPEAEIAEILRKYSSRPQRGPVPLNFNIQD